MSLHWLFPLGKKGDFQIGGYNIKITVLFAYVCVFHLGVLKFRDNSGEDRWVGQLLCWISETVMFRKMLKQYYLKKKSTANLISSKVTL